MADHSDYIIVIPARYASQRLPGKLLLDINGKPMLEHVWSRARSSAATRVIIATDDERIRAAATGFGAEVVMTSATCRSGSDRIAECAAQAGWADDQVVVNLQGDEPLIPPACLDQVARLLVTHPQADAASLCAVIERADEVTNPNVVKVVTDQGGFALLFSRAPIPWARDFESVSEAIQSGIRWQRHLGLYAYRCESLHWFARSSATPMECAERLEQLRFLESGRRIVLEQASEHIPAGVDTHEDLLKVRSLIK